MHCQRLAGGGPPLVDPLRLFRLPPPATALSVGLDLRLPWKTPVLSGSDKLTPCLLSPVPTPLPHHHHHHHHPLPHPLALLQQLRRHHDLMTSERLQASDAVVSKAGAPASSLALTPPSPLPALPAAPPGSAGFSAGLLTGVMGEERLRGGGAGGGGGSRSLPAAVPPPPPPPQPPLPQAPPPPQLMMMSESGGVMVGTSPYGRKLFPCPQCRYTTDRRNNLKRHMLTMHQLSAKMLECCGLLFRTKAALREHALVFHYHGYTCFYCARRFCRKALLKRHLSVHNGQKEFLCSVCDYATSHKSNLERHRRVHVRQDDDISGEGHDGSMMHDDADPLSDDVKSNVSETNSNIDVSCDELSVCSDDEDEEINVHSD